MFLSEVSKNKVFVDKWSEIDDAVFNMHQFNPFTCNATEIEKAWGYWIRETAIEYHVREHPHNINKIINEIVSNPDKLIAKYWIDRSEYYACNRKHFENYYYEDTKLLKFMCS